MPGRNGARRRENTVLFMAALLAAVGGLIYELILGTAASYLVGDSVLSFSLATGLTLFGMGLGSLLAPRIQKESATAFAVNEILLGIIGGNSVLLLYTAFGRTDAYWTVFAAISLVIGVLIGLEIPLLVRIFAQFGRPSSVDLLSKILAVDYFGALVASLVFPLVLLPHLGLMRGTYLVGALNVLVALGVLVQIRARLRVIVAAIGVAALLSGMFSVASALERGLDTASYRDPVVYYEQSAYQKIVLTQYHEDLRLYLNGQLQFSSLDERRYHETLSASAMTSAPEHSQVLILGGGDGLLAREVLRYDGVEHVTVVDIDPAVTEMARTNPLLNALNEGSLRDRRVEIRNEDAFTFSARAPVGSYDVVLIDLVDPSNEKVAKLYSVEFYQQVLALMSPTGVMVTQATSTFFSPSAFSTVASTVAAAQEGRGTYPFSINVPSFGEWGFVMSTAGPEHLLGGALPDGLTYQNMELLRFIILDNPVATSPMEISTLVHPRIVEVYHQDMRQWRYD